MVVAVVAVVVVVVVAVNLLAGVSVSASCAFDILMVGWWVDWFVYVLAVITWSSLSVGWLVRYCLCCLLDLLVCLQLAELLKHSNVD